MREAIVIALCAVGVFFSLTGAVGIIRMPDVYTRIQCSSKSITMGALPVLIALAVAEGPLSSYGGRALVVNEARPKTSGFGGGRDSGRGGGGYGGGRSGSGGGYGGKSRGGSGGRGGSRY